MGMQSPGSMTSHHLQTRPMMDRAEEPGPPEAIRRIVARTRTAMPELVDRAVEHIRRKIPYYDAVDLVSVDDLRASVQSNVEFVLSGLLGGVTDLSAPVRTGRRRATQGAPLVEMQSAYRVGFAEAWTALVEAVRSEPSVSNGVVVDLAAAIFELQGSYTDAAMDAYRDESQMMLRARERESAVLVEAILTGSAAEGSLWEAAQALRLPLDGSFLVVAAEAKFGQDPMPRVESALAVLDVRSVWRLEADLLVGLLSLPNRSRNDAVLEVLGRHAGARVGASPLISGLRQAAWGLRMARLALERDPAPEVAQFNDRPLSVLAAASPQVALETARAVLGGVLELPPDDRDLLLATLHAWVECGGSVKAAGALLFCHPNTVRHRLHRIEVGASRDLKRPMDVAELVTAANVWADLPHETPG